ncbi:hypothetical protein D1AOALGA4SA_8743 [Olavius algarvensis Delta 1 endosymbiont]|nr:hypothetical protein D1AOALGA4SA_8743 [Olavius algarvensis Delta 1 endosymbiont]
MIRAKMYATVGMAVFCLYLSCSPNASDAETAEAVTAAQNWLALIDEGEYGESWEEAAVYFKNALSKEKWEQMLTAVRGPLGQLISRDLKSKTYKKSLPGAPDGEYVIIQFKTSFENKNSAVETITPMLDDDNEWRVSGYYIK